MRILARLLLSALAITLAYLDLAALALMLT